MSETTLDLFGEPIAEVIDGPRFSIGETVRFRHPGCAFGPAMVVKSRQRGCGESWVYSLTNFKGEPSYQVIGVSEAMMIADGTKSHGVELETAELAASSLASAFHSLGSWRDQRSESSRQHWQQARSKWESAQARVSELTSNLK